MDDIFGIDNATTAVDLSGSHHQLLRRTLNDQSAANIAAYLEAQSDKAGIVQLSPASVGGVNRPSYCKLQRLSDAPLNGDGQWLAGTADTLLEGCTILAVCSSRAVYIVNRTPTQPPMIHRADVANNSAISGRTLTLYFLRDLLAPAMGCNPS